MFEKNDMGVKIFCQDLSTKNKIYHNNFINNTEHFIDEGNQTWDNGYPSGGNYWDDYNESDLYSGSGQNITGSDGFGDESYFEILNFTIDRYPLIQKWGEYNPVSKYTYSIVSKTVSFDASDSYDRDGTIDSYEWDFGDDTNGSGEMANHTYSQNGTYEITLNVTDDEGKNDTFSEHVFVGNDTIPPEIHSVSDSPDTVGHGFPVNITANVTDDFSGVKTVKVNITYPDDSQVNLTMNNTGGSIYYYVFSDSWQNGQYNYTIWAVDYAENINSSAGHSFNVSAQVNVSVCTVKDIFYDNETIKITDPPGEVSSKPPVGYELLDDNEVLHILNR